MNSIDKLTELFRLFPGIGPRQAKRFVYYLLARGGNYSGELAQAIENLKKEIVQCKECQRFFAKNGHKTSICSICSDDTRDNSLLMVVPRDIDLEAVEKSGSYKGQYFILGGVVPILDKEPEKKIRISKLEARIKEDKNIKEVILAMNANQDGEHTAEFLKEKLKNFKLQTSELGRGLSTGAELEYADPETLKNAFLHRTK
ncbi:MAG: recombination protein RecR [Candidatus Zambryskibacteria bacterium RIFCSPLOWO2_02_FULL_51_21]|uniref:Recombination protein RecR n=1 Tax=Candidatus Zambryskibacteria bacterium RIFCSPHIGHO2_02_FULL_43_37 TaxID=1802749 RepID=A0A1G2THA6_9BACT|nr:MAG: recombination protein RecR [Candidatus Zambryskibacteria bacterium RIFCSPHIGHO2_01_FULL_52_18]OHA96582.1 MAG: recombination protein RecR [Candidatus Zambryskibacteria bacterium RIFCSPHIGHO2_02_FULL_43_37]OHB07631.1 MAG: recombination protein RecR [Candidatus Zambryskibacteria bacterium RIFCSPLOWO2_01_FULL_52_12]OHB11154.1 MAG: recombination protein RecR [Candidatus Zambryskibacteria bacterium RIFCSPLOWO2_02_FULL_51_21]